MECKPINVLLIEDDEEVYHITRNILSKIKKPAVELDWVAEYEDARQAMSEQRHKVYFLDYRLGEHNGLDLLHEALEHGCRSPIIMLTGAGDHHIDVEAMKAGAADYLVKGRIDATIMERSLRYALERKQAEKALYAEKERLGVTLRSIGEGVITTDKNGHIELMNTEAEKLTGWSLTEAVGKPLTRVFNILNERTREPCQNPVEQVLTSNRTVKLENHTILLSKDGHERHIADTSAPIHDKDNQIIGVVVAFRDVTESQKVERELQKASRIESLGILAGGIAHDFNNLLTVILGNAQLAKMRQGCEGEVLENLARIEMASYRAKDLTKKFLSFAKGAKPIKKSAAISDLIFEAAQFALSGANSRCENNLQTDLWPVEIDQGLIGQALNNLFINANQAMPKGGVISVEAQNTVIKQNESLPLNPGKYVKITIQDHGEGIPPENLDKIFDPYFTTKTEGSGLGLATTYSIILNHDGYIQAESEVGVGTTFYIYLPASEKKVRSRNQREEKIIPGKGRILVMDDEKSITDIATKLLSKLGYEVTTAADGVEAINLVKKADKIKRPFDAVILDLTVPGGMGGAETIQKIHEIAPQVKAIVSSGYSNDPVMSEYKQHGFTAVIPKPYELSQLTKILQKVILTHLTKAFKN